MSAIADIEFIWFIILEFPFQDLKSFILNLGYKNMENLLKANIILIISQKAFESKQRLWTQPENFEQVYLYGYKVS